MTETVTRDGLRATAAIVGRPWTLLILDELAHEPRRFTELAQHLPGISTNLLSERLRTLTAAGIIARTPTPTSSTYALTKYGQALTPVLDQLNEWGLALPASTA